MTAVTFCRNTVILKEKSNCSYARIERSRGTCVPRVKVKVIDRCESTQAVEPNSKIPSHEVRKLAKSFECDDTRPQQSKMTNLFELRSSSSMPSRSESRVSTCGKCDVTDGTSNTWPNSSGLTLTTIWWLEDFASSRWGKNCIRTSSAFTLLKLKADGSKGMFMLCTLIGGRRCRARSMFNYRTKQLWKLW